MTEIGLKSAGELTQLIADKGISAVKLTEYFIARIQKFAELNAIVVPDFERAITAAKAADAALACGQILGPLHGLPMTIAHRLTGGCGAVRRLRGDRVCAVYRCRNRGLPTAARVHVRDA